MNGNLLNRVPALLSFVAIFSCLGTKFVHAQTITPTADGTQTRVNLNPNQTNQIDISGGTRSGGNLFHSFGQFGLNAGQVANFQSTANIQNILGRVTGGNASIINGTLQVTGSNANLFLLNPAGIIFGANAQLNVPGSFTATTANGIGFGNNQWFNAIGNNNYAALSSNPNSFAFANGSGGSLVNAGNLSVAQGQSLTLLGGTVINTGTLTAPGGTITIAAVPGQRLVRLSDSTSPLSIDLPLDPNAAINPTSFTPQSLPALLTGGNLPSATGITVENGIVSLTASSTPIATTAGSLTLAGRINTNAGTTTGNGGTILANASKTLVTGNLSAEGGTTSGNGGFIETSGKSLTIAPSTTVSTRAPKGVKGTWLLDPADLVVGASGTGTIAGGINSVADSTIAASTTVTALDGNNVDLQATNSITVNAAINASGNAGTGNLTLTAPTSMLNAPIVLKPGGTLNGTATTVNVGTNGTVQNGVDAAATGGIVNLAAATYALTQEVPINKDIIVRGIAANQTTVSGENAVRVFNVGSGNVTLESISIINGKTNGNGAGIQNASGTILTVRNSTVSNNISQNISGGISNEGAITIVNSTISNNQGKYAGGLFNTGTATLTNSTISRNTTLDAGSRGGGIFNTGTLDANNSTIVYNIAPGDGGGIFNIGTVKISNSIVSGNVSGNIANTAEVGNFGTFTSQGNNLVGQNNDARGFVTAANNTDIIIPGAIGTQIAPLAYTGTATTQTHAVLPGSLAINASGANATTTDQRGRSAVGIRDIGAYEFGGFQFSLATVGSNTKSTIVGTAFTPLVIQVIPNVTGETVAGGSIDINFTPTSNTNGAGLTNTAVQTITIGNDAKATLNATANTVTGSHSVSANATGNTGTAQVFNLTNTPELSSAKLTAVAGGGETTVNTGFTTALQVLVKDQYNNIIPNANVFFSSATGTNGASGLLDNTTSTIASGVTNTSGIITIAVKANTKAGGYITTASTDTSTSTVNFGLTNKADIASQVIALNSDGITPATSQSTAVTTAFGLIKTKVTDQFGNAIENATVTYSAPTGNATPGGSFSNLATAQTGSDGIATITLTANQKAGAFTATGTVANVTPIASYSLTNLAGPATTLAASGTTTQNVPVTTNFAPLQALVTDTFGNPVSGVTVSFAVPGSGASGTLSTVPAVTNASGIAVMPIAANTKAGSYQATGTSGTLTGTATYNLTNDPGAATKVNASGGNGQTAVVNTAFGQVLEATVTDTYGNPISGVSVSFVSPSSGASGTVTTISGTTNANGVATASVTANGNTGTFQATGSAKGLTNATYNLTNVANPASIPATIAIVNGTSNQSTTVNTAFTNPLQVLVSNSTGSPLANTPVTFTLPGAIGTSSSTRTVLTNANGIATLPVSALGTAGTFNPIATVNSLTTQFTLTNNAVAVIPVNPVTPITPVTPGNSGILTSVDQVRIGQNLQRLNPNAKTPALTSGGSSSLCIVRDRDDQTQKAGLDRTNDKIRTDGKPSENKGIPECKTDEKTAPSVTK